MSSRVTPPALSGLALVVLLSLSSSGAFAQGFARGNLVVNRVGGVAGTTNTASTAGATVLTNAATAVFLDEYTVAGTFVDSLALPGAVSGANRRFTNSGSATSEGQLNLSTNGNFLTIGGYDADAGTAAVVSTTSTAVNRIIGRIDVATGAVDTSTALTDAYSANNIRGVISTDGNSFYTAGTASNVANGPGVRYVGSLGATTSTLISSVPANVRTVNIFDGQLYTSSSSATGGNFRGVNAVGTGLPTTSGQTTTSVIDATGSSTYDFFFTDNGLTAYLADDRTTVGLQKYIRTDITSAFALAYNINTVTSTAQNGALYGFRSLAGFETGNSITFYAIGNGASGGSASALLEITDTISNTTLNQNTPTDTTLTFLQAAATNTAFRGVEFLAPITNNVEGPEPGSFALLATGLVPLWVVIRRRQKRATS